MPQFRIHGGGCCGVLHYVGFYGSRTEIRDGDAIKRDLSIHGYGAEPTSGGRTLGKCIEAVITDDQFRADPELAQKMKDAGFKLVTRFSNSTGGTCNVLHRVTGGRDLKKCRARHVRTLLS